jgi:hypothetical protein
MPLSDIVNISLLGPGPAITQAGFGVPLLLSANAAFGERLRFYASASAVEADFAVGTPEHKAASALFAQTPSPERLAIGRRANKPTQRFKISVQTVRSSQAYKVRVNATTFSFTSDASATNDEIVTGLAAAITGVAGFAASVQGAAPNTHVQLLASAPGNWAAVEVRAVNDNADLLLVEQDHADPGVGADLAAILLADSSWYAILSLYNSKAEALAIATFAEANKRLFIGATQDTNNITLATGDDASVSVMAAAKASAFKKTALLYHPDNGAFADAAWAGACLPLDPGSETWMFKTLATVPVVVLTATHQANLEGKNGNYYYAVAGRNITAKGNVSSGSFLDVERGKDFLDARLAERLFQRMADAKKVAFTDEGIGVLEAEVRAVLKEAQGQGLLAFDPAPTVTSPKAASISATNKGQRLLSPGIKFTATLQGAIHKLNLEGLINL